MQNLNKRLGRGNLVAKRKAFNFFSIDIFQKYPSMTFVFHRGIKQIKLDMCTFKDKMRGM